MCKFEQNISHDVKKTTKSYVKSKLLSIYIHIENLYTENTKVTNHMFPLIIYWTSENLVK